MRAYSVLLVLAATGATAIFLCTVELCPTRRVLSSNAGVRRHDTPRLRSKPHSCNHEIINLLRGPCQRTYSSLDAESVTDREFNLLPAPQFAKPIPEILAQPWLRELQSFLAALPECDALVSVVCSDTNYREILLNWLISAAVRVHPPLTNILILSLDKELHALMKGRGFPTILVSPGSVIDIVAHNLSYSSGVFLTRLTVLRLITLMGYSVAHYDIDAIILKNPELLYERYKESDLVASVGWWPTVLAQKPPGFTLCMGAVYMRSTPQIESLWAKISQLKLITRYAQDDQIRLNYGLKNMAIEWQNSTKISEEAVTGTGKGGLRVTALSTRQVCRRALTCKKDFQEAYYIWHGRGEKSRESKATATAQSGFWYLSRDWEAVSKETESLGAEWLKEITVDAYRL